MRHWFLSIIMILPLAVTVAGQAQGGGGAAAGLGKTFEAAGRSEAAKGLQRKLNTALVRAVNKERSRPRPQRPSRPKTVTSAEQIIEGPDPATSFRPDPRSDTMETIASELTTDPTERAQLVQLFAATKTAFEEEVAAKGRANNLAAAFTFFIASTVMVYRDDPEPTDAALDALWDGMNTALGEMPEVSNLTNAEKQQMYDMLVAFSGFVLAGHMEGKASGDGETKRLFKTLAGELIRTIMQTEPDKLRFTNAGLSIAS